MHPFEASDGQSPMMMHEYDHGFFPPQPAYIRQPLDYHLYSHPLPQLPPSHFISETLYSDLQQRSETQRTVPAPGLSLPEELQGYHTLVPLETSSGERRKFGSWHSTVYRATGKDDRGYALRRVETVVFSERLRRLALSSRTRVFLLLGKVCKRVEQEQANALSPLEGGLNSIALALSGFHSSASASASATYANAYRSCPGAGDRLTGELCVAASDARVRAYDDNPIVCRRSREPPLHRVLPERDEFPYRADFRLMHQAAFTSIEQWSKIRHPNIVSVHEAFTTRSFGDSSLVVAYSYHPNAVTLYEAHIKPKAPTFQNGRLQAQPQLVSERTLWSYVIQIAGAIKTVHEKGLAVRMVDPSKVLVTGKNRVRISSCGLADVLSYSPTNEPLSTPGAPSPATSAYTTLLQQEDLVSFGKLIFALCCGSTTAINNLNKALETLSKNFSADVKNVALFCLSKPGIHKHIGQLFDMIGSRLLTEMDEMQNGMDYLEGELLTELENARLVRLLCKFGFINERPEFARDARWSETGDRYIIKLFRDFVFHQVDEHGQPVVNLSHVLTCLNKLDAGTDERMMLVSRDEQSVLVVSYKDVKACVESAFRRVGSELARR
ncbi:hypothetical protein EVG20_g7096 [Dentipellis fragilis]|uniref:PAN2-PAN3 deadenylation complex subunit PAN3 n=1 Tax=Dentipellis fragilis TaxID=205917 RepID=A0A4Y9YK68_9AGAM|nr:hypothetical protein EVG20_g7096 [Dentipellis fragilis]